MSETTEILEATLDDLERREAALVEQIEEVQASAKQELRDVRKALGSIRKQIGGASVGKTPPQPVSDETKDAVLRELEARKQDGGAGARIAGIAKVAQLQENAVRDALAELKESGDVESMRGGLWRIAE